MFNRFYVKILLKYSNNPIASGVDVPKCPNDVK